MRSLTVLVFSGVFAGLAASAAAEQAEDIVYRPYFGGAYEQGWLTFKTNNRYGKTLTGYAPFAGVTMGKYFAFEMAWRMAYGAGGSDAPVSSTVVTDKATVRTDSVTSYHSSSSGIGLDLMVRYPLGNTGLAPFVFTGVSIDKLKENGMTVATVTSRPLGMTDASKDTVDSQTTYKSIVGKSEISPELGFGLAYSYGGAEVRVSGRIQNLNMGNSGKYMATMSAGLLLKI